MNNKARAEKIHDFIFGKCARPDTRLCASMQFIIPQLDEVVREAYSGEEKNAFAAKAYLEGFVAAQREGFADCPFCESQFAIARERAAKIAEDHIECVNYTKRDCPERIAERIRAMEPDK